MIILAPIITALIAVESQGNALLIGDGGEAYGILQIHPCVIEDVNRVYHTSYRLDDRKDDAASIKICELYLGYWGTRYEERTHKSATPEVLARIWNGGPNGWRKESTRAYWAKVEKETAKESK